MGLGKGLKVASVNEILATRARATFSYRINFDNIKIGNVKPMNEWCESNCRGLWRSETYHALYWQFEDEQDATMFMLRWAQAEGNKIK
jgi:hypothetical protein